MLHELDWGGGLGELRRAAHAVDGTWMWLPDRRSTFLSSMPTRTIKKID